LLFLLLLFLLLLFLWLLLHLLSHRRMASIRGRLVACCLYLLPLAASGAHLRDADSSQGVDDENHCEVVSSRGIMRSCDVFPRVPQSDAVVLTLLEEAGDFSFSATERMGMSHYVEDIESKGPGVVVYVVPTALSAFVSEVLPQIRKPFTLVTGDSDQGPIASLKSKAEFDKLADDERLIHWFSQNALDEEAKHPKVSQMPIGLDFHTMRTTDVWGPKASPQKQESDLFASRMAAPSFANRTSMVEFSGSESSAIRGRIIQMLQAQPQMVEMDSTGARVNFWESVGRHRFVASPPGNGVDCHRTWEVLALGSIPLVSSKLHGLYERHGINVVTMEDKEWGQLKSPGVQKKMEEASERALAQGNEFPDYLKLQYWMSIIRAANGTKVAH